MISADATFFSDAFVIMLFQELTCIIDQNALVNYKGILQNAYIMLHQIRFFLLLLFHPQRFLFNSRSCMKNWLTVCEEEPEQ